MAVQVDRVALFTRGEEQRELMPMLDDVCRGHQQPDICYTNENSGAARTIDTVSPGVYDNRSFQ